MLYVWHGLKVGDLEGGTLTKNGKQLHRLNFQGSFGTAKDILEDPQVKAIRFKYGGQTYFATVETINTKGFLHPFRHKADCPTCLGEYTEPQIQLRQEDWEKG